ncbi:MAG TPA: 3-deoxy-8-phosphooctulonate synthase [Thermoanaerobaculia bacterium]|nr:3-deoxy-8-phosphooctulonate synthase [Thermoanaerobaculia bacterium]
MAEPTSSPAAPRASADAAASAADPASPVDIAPRTVAPAELAPGVVLGGEDFPVIAGPCVVENEEHTLETARIVAGIARRLGVPVVFKASFDKANRSSIASFRGPGLAEGLRVLAAVQAETGLAVTTDVHQPEQCAPAAEVCDVLQIPAFLCRQTDLLLAAADTGRAVNVKKGQFLAPGDALKIAEKVWSRGNRRFSITERGYTFGYNNLVVDMRSFQILHEQGVPVVFDITHSLQLPGGGAETGGDRRFAEPLARAAVAAGADGVFLEIHPDPENALSDRTTQLAPERAEALLASLLAVRRAVRAVPAPA